MSSYRGWRVSLFMLISIVFCIGAVMFRTYSLCSINYLQMPNETSEDSLKSFEGKERNSESSSKDIEVLKLHIFNFCLTLPYFTKEFQEHFFLLLPICNHFTKEILIRPPPSLIS